MIPWRRKRQPTLMFLPEKPHGQRSLVGYSPCGHKESGMTTTKSSSEFQYSCAYPKIESLVNKQLLALNQYFSNLKVYEKNHLWSSWNAARTSAGLGCGPSLHFSNTHAKTAGLQSMRRAVSTICSFFFVVHSVVSNYFVTQRTIPHWAPLSVGFSRQEY